MNELNTSEHSRTSENDREQSRTNTSEQVGRTRANDLNTSEQVGRTRANDLNTSRKPLTLKEAADLLGTSRSRVWRAMSEGYLSAEKRRVAGRSTWTVCEDDLREWAREWLEGSDLSGDGQALNSSERLRTSANDHEHSRTNAVNSSEHPQSFMNDRERSRTSASTSEHIEHEASPPLELYLEMLDRLQRAERRSIELELQLRQSQRLLTENAESITEKEALALEARARLQAVEDANQTKAERLAAELEKAEKLRVEETERLQAELNVTRQQLSEAQKPSGLFSWLGLRKKRTSSISIDKAV